MRKLFFLIGCILVAGCAVQFSDRSTPATATLPSPASTIWLRPTSSETATATGSSTTASSPSPSSASSPTESGIVTLAAVGDIMLGRSIGARITQGAGDEIFSAVAPLLDRADLVAGNLECAIGDDGVRANKGYTFRAPLASAGLLASAGFDVLSLANNHILDYGAITFAQTLNLLHSEEIGTVGAGENAQASRSPFIVERNGIRLAFLAYADIPIEYSGFDARSWIAGPESPGIAWADSGDIDADIHVARSQADIVIVFLHFGVEGAAEPNQDQIGLAHQAIDSGANIVLGSHPHVLQTLEEYHGGLIAYSLGNFVFDEFDGPANTSEILDITISVSGSISYSLIPVVIRDGLPNPA